MGGGDWWNWEGAWEQMTPEMRGEVATVDGQVLEAAMHRATQTNRFCADCKRNVVQALDILMGDCHPEDADNGDEFNEVRHPHPLLNLPTGLISLTVTPSIPPPQSDCDPSVHSFQEFDAQSYSSSGQRHAATLEQGQKEVRSILGGVLLNQLWAEWHAHMARVQSEHYLFCLTVDAIRTSLASGGHHQSHYVDLLGAEEATAVGAG
ncbi:unnamed protein product, partial [Discosporangium mesarthrocarpum]